VVKQAHDQPHSKFKHVYPIVRIDTPFDQMHPTNTVAVVKVLTSQVDLASLSSVIIPDCRRRRSYIAHHYPHQYMTGLLRVRQFCPTQSFSKSTVLGLTIRYTRNRT
jgi:hypothetical protein